MQIIQGIIVVIINQQIVIIDQLDTEKIIVDGNVINIIMVILVILYIIVVMNGTIYEEIREVIENIKKFESEQKNV